MPTLDSYVYVIRGRLDSELAIVIVGDANEWNRVWAMRHEHESDATLWLRTLNEQPKLDRASLTWPDHGNRCRTYARGVTAQLEQAGVEILNLRRHDTYNGGKKNRRPCFCAEYGWHKSVRAAARRIGISHTILLERLNDPSKPEYRFDTPTHETQQ